MFYKCVAPMVAVICGALSGGSDGAMGQVVATNPSEFQTAIAGLGTPTVIDFEEIDASPVNNTIAGRDPFDGNTFAAQGISFSSPNAELLFIAPGGLFWNTSNSLSVGEFPFGSPNITDDDLVVTLDPPVIAIGLALVDNASQREDEFIQFMDANGNLLHQSAFPPDFAPFRAFLGLVSVDQPIATIRIEEASDDGDDVNYDDFIFLDQLDIKPTRLSFSFVREGMARNQNLNVSNHGVTTLSFRAEASTQSGGGWLSVTPENGDVTPAEAVALTVRADPGSLPPGTYLGEIRISSSAIPQIEVVPVTMAISRRQQLLRLSQTGATFIAVSGTGPVAPRSFRVLNEGLGVLQWSITPTTLSGGPWLSAEPAAGMTNAASSSAVEIRVDPAALEPDVYYGVLEIAAPEAASSPQFVTVVLPLLAPGSDTLPAVFPTGLLFAASESGPAPDSQSVTITNLTDSPLSFTSSRSTVDGNDWFGHTPTESAVPPAGTLSIDVQADPTGLAAGIYRGTLSLSFDDGSTATVDLVFVVAATETTNLKQAGRLQSACQRSELAPVFQVLGTTSAIPAAWPARIEVGVVDNCGNPMQEGLVGVEFSNIASPNLALGRSEPGVWSGTWDVPNADQQVDGSVTATATDAEGLTGSFTASVALAPNAAPAPQVNAGGVVHAASFVAEPLAPGTIISIFGSALSREPTDGGQLAPSLPLPSDLAGTEITIGGVPVPLIFSREDQLNAVIPFELLDRANETLPVLVHRIGARSVSLSEPVLVTAARPGVFTLNATGRGAAVVQDGNFETVNAANPVAPGDVITIFCTGLGPVEPEVPSGAAAPLSPLSWVVEEVEVTIGGVPATVQFAGLTPGFAGLYQINAFVPEGISLGQPQLVVSIAGQKSLVVTVAVR